MSYIITVVISVAIGFILCTFVISKIFILVEPDLVSKVRYEALKCGNGLIQFAMLKTLKMLNLEDVDENNL